MTKLLSINVSVHQVLNAVLYSIIALLGSDHLQHHPHWTGSSTAAVVECEVGHHPVPEESLLTVRQAS